MFSDYVRSGAADETIFTVDPHPIEFGADARALGISRAAVFTDAVVRVPAPPRRALAALAPRLVEPMRAAAISDGIEALGRRPEAVPGPVHGVYRQSRPLVLSPRAVGRNDLAALDEDAMRSW